jgi:hypothetical protein
MVVAEGEVGCDVGQLRCLIAERQGQRTGHRPSHRVLFYRLDGAYSRVREDATAFSGGRSPRFAVFVIGVCPAPDMFAAEREWVRSMADALAPFAVADGTYVNGMTDFDALRPVRSAYGPEKYARLVDVKTTYDPHNIFHRNANIAPTVP